MQKSKFTTDQIMIDNETLNTTPDAIILSIGAVKFDKRHPEDGLGHTFYAVLDVEDQRERGRTESPETVAWWAKQSPEARTVLKAVKRPVKEVLDELFDFIYDMDSPFGPGKNRIWGNGADFDNPQIASLFAMYGFSQPWEFWNNRCFRTLKSEFGMQKHEPKRGGVHHNALDDAIHQAKWCQNIFADLNKSITLKV